jgi:hypothetical protein
MKTVIAKKDFYLGEIKTLQEGKEYKIVNESINGIVIKNDLGGKQGFNKNSEWIDMT